MSYASTRNDYLTLIAYCLLAAALPEAGASAAGPLVDGGVGPVRVSGNPNWLEFRGRPILLVGDSITQGWMELGQHFDTRAYLDALARRGINALLLWSFIGVEDQSADERIGYDAPEVWPWIKEGTGKFDLRRLNDSYFHRLRSLISDANARDVVVIITIHDGWPKTRFAGHPFSLQNGGPLEAKSQYVELHDYDGEMSATFDACWGRKAKHQYFLERFCDRLIQAAGDAPNVMYEVFNEGEWYDQVKLRAFQLHFVTFVKARTPRPVLVNDDHVAGASFRDESAVDIISLHKPRWDDMPGAAVFFRHFESQFFHEPIKPVFFSEPAPDYSGEPGRLRGVMRLLWGTAIGGAGVVFQNDASWGFDPRSAMAAKAAERSKVLDLEGYAATFFNRSGVDFCRMRPNGRLSSSGVCLANPGEEYVMYRQANSPPIAADLSHAVGRKLTVRWYDPWTGEETAGEPVDGGQTARFVSPVEGDSVLHLKSLEQ